MKRRVAYVLMICMLMALCAACGKQKESNGKTSIPKKESTVEVESAYESESVSEPESTEEPGSKTESEPVSESEPEVESEPESASEPENTMETESSPEESFESEPETEEADTLVGEELDAAELMEDMKAVFDSALNYIVPEEELDAASRVSNAILNKTDIIINRVEDGVCNVTVTYPNAAEALKEAEAQLAADASQEEIDVMLDSLAKTIENGEVETIEKTLDVTVIEIGSFRTIEWTKELYDAITGGLYSIE
ncbi:MAG: hypothetical protein IJ282_07365 [Lachnospiraceae bacterium]|nr:hypothetical protein [Lachnospiraceae bacterium]